jgi:menaquinone-specific isochorismate synthase
MPCSNIEENCLFYFKQRIAHLNLLDWLAVQPIYPKFYWKEKNSTIERAALGSIHSLDSPPTFSTFSEDARWYGALSFFPHAKVNHPWSDFPSCYFFLPEFEIEQNKDQTYLIIRSREETDPSRQKERLRFSFSPLPAPTFNHYTRQYLPSQSKWSENIRSCLRFIQEHTLQKIVLARRTTFHFSSLPHPFSLLQRLGKQSQHGTLFAYQTSPQSAFLGASPEILYRRKGTNLLTESIAGTRRRGKTLEEDNLLQQQLHDSPKEKREFNFVKEFLSQQLSTLCSHYSCSEQDSIIQTATVQHLYNHFTGTLCPSISDQALLSSLHPTPAIGGIPRKRALELLPLLEPFDRGLYASPIGWLSSQESCFAVGIRSALAQNNDLHIFAGTGIVEGSDPDREWEELEYKISQWGL